MYPIGLPRNVGGLEATSDRYAEQGHLVSSFLTIPFAVSHPGSRALGGRCEDPSSESTLTNHTLLPSRESRIISQKMQRDFCEAECRLSMSGDPSEPLFETR